MRTQWKRSIFFILFMMASGAPIFRAQAESAPAPAVTVPEDAADILVRYGRAEHTQLSQDKDVNVVVWNVHKFSSQKIFSHVENLAQKSDFVLLQESMMRGSYDQYFSRFLEMLWVGAISFIDSKNNGTGVATAGRIRPSQVRFVQSDAREPILNTPKMLILSHYPIGQTGQELLVANIHCVNFVRTQDYVSQLEQLVQAVSAHQGPLIVGGDFNTYTIWRSTALREAADRLGLNYVLMENNRYGRLNLDHLFVRDMNVVRAQKLFEVEGSDHAPLAATLQFQRSI